MVVILADLAHTDTIVLLLGCIHTPCPLIAASRSLPPTPPDKGSFPLDHSGKCRQLVDTYLVCLMHNRNNQSLCKDASRQYLQCRMQYNLMAKEDLAQYGLGDPKNEKANQTTQTLAKLDSYVQHHPQVQPTDITHAKQAIDEDSKNQHLQHINR